MTNAPHKSRRTGNPATGTMLKNPFSSKKKNSKQHRHPRATYEYLDGQPALQTTPDKCTASPDSDVSEIDSLISQFRESFEQGRIFDARTLVHQIHAFKKEQKKDTDPEKFTSIQSKLRPLQHLLEETLTQSTHVESLLHDLHSNENWTLAKEKSGVTVHYRREDNSPIHLVRAQANFTNFEPIDFVRLCSLFVETEHMPNWFPGGVMKKANVLSWHSKYSKVIQLHISLGILPMTSPRDAVVYGNGYHLPDRNAFLISSKSIIDESSCRYCEIPRPDKGIVRMTTESIFYIELVQHNVISFKLIGKDDLKFRFMPSALLNYISQGHMPFDLTRTIRHRIRNFEGSIWEEKMKERRDYYKEIEDKVYKQLEVWKKEGKDNKDGKSVVKTNEDETDKEQLSEMKPLNVSNNLSLSEENKGDAQYFKPTTIAAVLAVFIAMVFYFVENHSSLISMPSNFLGFLIILLLGLMVVILALKSKAMRSNQTRKRQHGPISGANDPCKDTNRAKKNHNYPVGDITSFRSPPLPRKLFETDDDKPFPSLCTPTSTMSSGSPSVAPQKPLPSKLAIKKAGSFLSIGPRGIRKAISMKTLKSKTNDSKN